MTLPFLSKCPIKVCVNLKKVRFASMNVKDVYLLVNDPNRIESKYILIVNKITLRTRMHPKMDFEMNSNPI